VFVPHSKLSDRGLAVFAFALYHQLESGSRVTQVVRADGSGHHADDAAIRELEGLGLVPVENDRIAFTREGEDRLDRVLAGMRNAAGPPST
jgi:hypothetical protein